MNRLYYLLCPLLLSGLLAGRPLLAQDSMRQFVRPAVLKTNLLYPLSLALELPTTLRQSFQFSVHYLGFQGTSSGWSFTPGAQTFTKVRYVNVSPEYRFYLARTASARRPAPKGWYLGPYLKYHYEKDFTSTSYQGSTRVRERMVAVSSFGGGVLIGAQLITRGGFVVDGVLGRGYFPFINYQSNREPELYRYRNDYHFGLSIGGAFSRPGTYRRTHK